MDFKDWISYEGTIEKNEFIKRVLICIGLSFLLVRISLLGPLIGLALGIVIGFNLARRLRTLGMNPWLALLGLVPIVGLLFLIYIMIKD